MADVRTLPLLPLRGMMVFPYMIIHLDVGRERSVAALEQAMVSDRQVVVTAQKDAEVDEPTREELYDVGTVVEIRQVLKLPGGTVRVLVEGLHRALIMDYRELDDHAEVDVQEYQDESDQNEKDQDDLYRCDSVFLQPEFGQFTHQRTSFPAAMFNARRRTAANEVGSDNRRFSQAPEMAPEHEVIGF